MCILFFHAHPPLFFSYSFAVSVFHALHAVYDVDAGRQVVPLLGQLYAVKVVDALPAGGHVGCNGADAVVVMMMKFCDPEEFDYPIYYQELENAGIRNMMIEVDQESTAFEQIRTRLQTFKEIL